MTERIVVGMDIGTTKVCTVVAKADELGRINIIGMGIAKSDGINRGVVVNINRTVDAVREATAEAERSASVTVQSVVAGIAGDHIRSLQSRGVVTIVNHDQQITQRDLRRLLEDTTHVALPADQEILHVLPQEYIVDGQDGVTDPVGMSGVRLEANVHIITGLVTAAKNIYRCIERAGYQVVDIVLEPLASSFAVLHGDEKEIGVALIDIGGGTTDIAVFEDGTIRHAAVIAVAGNKVTDDLRRGLGVRNEDAEQLKQQFGSALAEIVEEPEDILIPGIGGRSEKRIARSALAQIIQPRMEEILEFAVNEIRLSGYRNRLAAGAVLTGGGSLTEATAALGAEVLGMEARVGYPTGIAGGLVDEVTNPKYATAVGLVLYALQPRILGAAPIEGHDPNRSRSGAIITRQDQTDHSTNLMQRIAGRMRDWFNEF